MSIIFIPYYIFNKQRFVKVIKTIDVLCKYNTVFFTSLMLKYCEQ
jgi:hypothetical protein